MDRTLATIARWLRLAADWLDPPVVVVPPDQGPLLARAGELVGVAERIFGAGFGEAKRHQVYARLTKDFPDISRRVISRAIEAALGEGDER